MVSGIIHFLIASTDLYLTAVLILLWFGLNFYFICITDIITKQYNNSEIHVQTFYKWDSEGSQMTYFNLYPKHVERHSVRKLLAIVVMFN